MDTCVYSAHTCASMQMVCVCAYMHMCVCTPACAVCVRNSAARVGNMESATPLPGGKDLEVPPGLLHKCPSEQTLCREAQKSTPADSSPTLNWRDGRRR